MDDRGQSQKTQAMHHVCCACHAPNARLKCSCNAAYYCGPACQHAHSVEHKCATEQGIESKISPRRPAWKKNWSNTPIPIRPKPEENDSDGADKHEYVRCIWCECTYIFTGIYTHHYWCVYIHKYVNVQRQKSSWVRHGSFVREAWHIHTRDMNHSQQSRPHWA